MIELWTGKDLQRTLAMLIHFEGHGITELAAIKARIQTGIDAKMADGRRRIIRSRVERRAIDRRLHCDACGGPVVLAPVNDSPSTQIGGDYRTAIVCRDNACLHVEYSARTIADLIAEARGRGK